MSLKEKYLTSIIISFTGILFTAIPAFAHVIVSPNQVGIAKVQVFDMSVPTEKDVSTVGIKLVIPPWITGEVVPNVKPGWTINVLKNKDIVTEIDWIGGTIPPGQRDDFYFQAQVPASELTLKWKAIQMYQDGSTVEWIHDPTSNPEDDSAPPPYSTTKVVNDLTDFQTQPKSNTMNLPLIFSIVAIVLSAISLGISIQRKKEAS